MVEHSENWITTAQTVPSSYSGQVTSKGFVELESVSTSILKFPPKKRFNAKKHKQKTLRY